MPGHRMLWLLRVYEGSKANQKNLLEKNALMDIKQKGIAAGSLSKWAANHWERGLRDCFEGVSLYSCTVLIFPHGHLLLPCVTAKTLV